MGAKGFWMTIITLSIIVVGVAVIASVAYRLFFRPESEGVAITEMPTTGIIEESDAGE